MVAVARKDQGKDVGAIVEGRRALAFLARTAGIEVPGSGGGAAQLAACAVADAARDSMLGDVADAAIVIRRVEEYQAVMAPYRDRSDDGGLPADVVRHMEAVREFGPLPERLVTDQDGGLLKGYRALEGLSRLAESEPGYAWVLEDARRNRLVRVVSGQQDARRQIRQLHLQHKDSAIKGRDYDLVIADQVRDFQARIDGIWEEMARANFRITGRFRLSSNFVGRLLGIDNKRVDRVLTGTPDLAELLYLDVLDARGIIQRGKARPEDPTRRGRKAADSGRAMAGATSSNATGRAVEEGCRGEHRGVEKDASRTASDDHRDEADRARDWTSTAHHAPETRPCRVDPAAKRWRTQPAAGSTRQVNQRDPDRDPIYDLGWRLYAIIREVGWDDDVAFEAPGAGSDSATRSGEMVAWFSRVQGYLRGLEDRAARSRAYQRILFVGLSAELCQRVMVDDIGDFAKLCLKLIRRLQDDHPIVFDRVEEWVVRQAADWWSQARRGIYHVPRCDGTVFVKGRTHAPALRLDDLPSPRALAGKRSRDALQPGSAKASTGSVECPAPTGSRSALVADRLPDSIHGK